MKRILSELLAALTLASLLAACGDTPDAARNASGTPDAAVEATADADVETTTAELKPDIPDADFGGYVFTWLTSSDTDANGVDWVTYDVYTEEQNGDPINDAVYTRNLYISDTYNVQIAEHQDVTLTAAQKAVLAGDNIYDAVITNFNAAATLAQSGQVYDLNEIPYIDLSRPWWDQNAVETLSIAGHNYYATGDITVIVNDATWVVMFNKQMAENYGFGMYDLVRNDTWDFEKFRVMCETVGADLNGDGKMVWNEDRFGLICTGDTAQALLYAGGMLIAGKDEDDLPVLMLDLNKYSGIAEKATALMSNTDVCIGNHMSNAFESTDQIRECFQNGSGLFYTECMQCITRMRQSETDFGVMPWPKMYEAQENYYSFVHYTAGKCAAVLMTQTDLELAGTVIEAMAAKSMYTLTPAYYDVSMTHKMVRDDESIEMLDITLSNRILDLGYVYDWGGMYTALHDTISSGKGGFVTAYESKVTACETAMQKTVDTYLEAN